jgi:TolB protein
MSPLAFRLLIVSCVASLTTAPSIARVTTSRAPSAPARLAFASHRDGDWNVYVMPAEGGPATRLTSRPEQERFPLWSPDGATLAYGVQANGGWELWTMAADGTAPRRLFRGIAAKGHREWSPDGTRIVFGSGGDDSELYTIRPDGSELRRVATSPGADRDPT